MVKISYVRIYRAHSLENTRISRRLYATEETWNERDIPSVQVERRKPRWRPLWRMPIPLFFNKNKSGWYFQKKRMKMLLIRSTKEKYLISFLSQCLCNSAKLSPYIVQAFSNLRSGSIFVSVR